MRHALCQLGGLVGLVGIGVGDACRGGGQQEALQCSAKCHPVFAAVVVRGEQRKMGGGGDVPAVGFVLLCRIQAVGNDELGHEAGQARRTENGITQAVGSFVLVLSVIAHPLSQLGLESRVAHLSLVAFIYQCCNVIEGLRPFPEKVNADAGFRRGLFQQDEGIVGNHAAVIAAPVGLPPRNLFKMGRFNIFLPAEPNMNDAVCAGGNLAQPAFVRGCNAQILCSTP